jgi:hypothetical protein
MSQFRTANLRGQSAHACSGAPSDPRASDLAIRSVNGTLPNLLHLLDLTADTKEVSMIPGALQYILWNLLGTTRFKSIAHPRPEVMLRFELIDQRLVAFTK